MASGPSADPETTLIASVTASYTERDNIAAGHLFNRSAEGLTDEDQNTRNRVVARAQHQILRRTRDVTRTPYQNQGTFPSARDVLAGRVDHTSLTTSFENKQQAQLYLTQLRVERQVADDTLPRTPEQKRQLAAILFQAFKSQAKANDGQRSLAPFSTGLYENKLVEILCWRILDNCIERSSIDSLLKPFGGDLVGTPALEVPFADHYDAIIRALSMWKTTAKQAFEPPY